MKAIIKNSKVPNDVSFTQLQIPDPVKDEVVARVAYAGICGSDLEILHGQNPIYQPPVVQGHEFSAIITAIGEDVKDFQVGDKIVSETAFRACNECQMCKDGNYHICLRKDIVGWTENGGFAEYVKLRAPYLHKLTSQTDMLSAALIEPSAIALETLYVKGKINAGDTIAVVGPGTIGILCALMAKQLGASEVFLLGLDDAEAIRFKIARKLGINDCINISATDARAYITNKINRDVDVVVDATGNIKGFNTSLELVKRNGKLLEVGSITHDTLFPWSKAAFKSIELHFIFSSSHVAWVKVVEIFNTNNLNLKELVTHSFSLSQYQEAFQTAANPGQSLKVVFNQSTNA